MLHIPFGRWMPDFPSLHLFPQYHHCIPRISAELRGETRESLVILVSPLCEAFLVRVALLCGGFNNLLICSPIIGQMIWLDLAIFLEMAQMGWNHQLVWAGGRNKELLEEEVVDPPMSAVAGCPWPGAMAAWFRVWHRFHKNHCRHCRVVGVLSFTANFGLRCSFQHWSTQERRHRYRKRFHHTYMWQEIDLATGSRLANKMFPSFPMLKCSPTPRRWSWSRGSEPMPTCRSWLTWDLNFANYPSLERR